MTGTTQATILSGTTGIDFTITGLDDLLVEGLESIIVDITGAVLNGTEFATQQQTVNIIDNDVAEVLLAVSTGYLAEATGEVTVTLATSGDVIINTGIMVTLTYAGTATDGIDYTT